MPPALTTLDLVWLGFGAGILVTGVFWLLVEAVRGARADARRAKANARPARPTWEVLG